MDKYPVSHRCLPANFARDRTDNAVLLEFENAIYGEPFSALKPSPLTLGVNKKSTRVSTTIARGEIYVIWAVGTTLYKIGVSTNFNRRFRDLTSNSPLPLVVVKYARCDHPHLLETKFHAMFAKKVFKNEWFSLDASDMEAIESIFDRYFDSPKIVASSHVSP